MTGQVRTLEGGLMRDKLVDETCPPQESIKELDVLNGKITKQKQRNEAYERVQKLMGVNVAPNK